MSSLGSTVLPSGVPSYRNMDIFGPFVVGNILACLLTGALYVATWFYFSFRKNDGWLNKSIVWILLVLCTGDTVSGSVRVVKMCVIDGSSFLKLIDLTSAPEEVVRLFTTNLACIAAQAFLAFKGLSFIWAMRHTYGRLMRWTLSIIATCLVLSLAATTAFAVGNPIYYIRFKSYLDFIDTRLQYHGIWEDLFIAHLTLSCVVDVLLTLILSLAFRHARTGFEESNVVVNSVVTVTIRNGLLLTVCQIVQMTLAHSGHVGWSVMIYVFAAKLYGLTVIAFLCGPKLKQAAWQDRHDLEAAQAGSPDFLPTLATEKSASRGHIGSGAESGTGSGNGGISSGTMVASSLASTRCRVCHGSGLSGPFVHPMFNSPKLSVGFGTPPSLSSARMKDDNGIVGLRAALLGLDEQSDELHGTEEKAENPGASQGDAEASALAGSGAFVQDLSALSYEPGRKDE